MELPKNITQIGESDHHCKIYVEDYVISYMKQLNRLAMDKDMAVALYGIRREENEVSYLFVYGAAKLTFLQRETRHLSQAQQQETEKLRKRYFQDYVFLGYRLLNGEMVEGVHICEQGICRYIAGYAQFYEKNDSMLAYMLDVREEAQPEVIDQEKYNVVKKRQEVRRLKQEEESSPKAVSSSGMRRMRLAVVAVFALLCLVGLTTLNGNDTVNELQAMARQVMDGAMEQRIPDAAQEGEAVGVDTLITEDKLAEAVRQENTAAGDNAGVEGQEAWQVSAQGVTGDGGGMEETVSEPALEPEETTASEPALEPEGATASEPAGALEPEEETASQPALEAETVSETVPEQQPVSYTIKEGDTLIGISVRNYGSDEKVSEICSLNQIANPDDIKVGQKILLP